MGRRTQSVPIEKIRYFTVLPRGDQAELVVAYDRPDGRRAALRTHANAVDSQFKALADELARLFPHADLRARPAGEALKLMGVADSQKVVGAAIAAVMISGAALAGGPFLIHGLDQGSAPVGAGELKAAKLSSRNLVLNGELDVHRYLEVTSTKNGTKESASFRFAVFPAGAASDDPVAVVLSTREMGGDDIDALARQGEWRCRLRNVWWEGLDDDDVKFMRDELHLNLGSQTPLCELDDGHGPPELFMFGAFVGTAVLLTVIIGIAMARQRKAKV